MGVDPAASDNIDSANIPAEAWVRVLTGDLPCAKCRYNLRGLSILEVCPECGTPVRGTILATVDPHAKELLPIHAPVLTAGGLILWASSGLLAGLAVLALRADEVIASLRHAAGTSLLPGQELQTLRMVPAVLTATAGIGALAFVRPHARINWIQSAAATLGVAAHFPLAYLLWYMLGVMDNWGVRADASPYMNPDPVTAPWRSLMRLGCAACIAIIILGVRPNGRLLVSRSLLMRSGRVDRQTLLVILAAVGLASLGDVLRLGERRLPGDQVEVLQWFGAILIAVGSLLSLLGLIGVLIDVLRLRYSILTPPLSLEQVAPAGPAGPAGAGKAAGAPTIPAGPTP